MALSRGYLIKKNYNCEVKKVILHLVNVLKFKTAQPVFYMVSLKKLDNLNITQYISLGYLHLSS